MNQHDSQKALERILLMIPRTEANGASQAEAEAAAKHIGRMIMQFPQLLPGYVTSRPKKRRPPSDPNGTVVLKYNKLHLKTFVYVHIDIRGFYDRIPMAHVVWIDADYICLKEDFARARGYYE